MFIGDTAKVFFEETYGKYRHYYGFEPDNENYDTAVKNLAGKTNVTTIPKGLWSSETQLAFNGSLGSSSEMSKDGEIRVDVTALDVYFSDKTPPTFIKMDIEGAELEALKGAERMIRENKPKLAICAYHNPEDVYTLLELVKSYRDDYKFYLRHYTNSLYETVLYAI
jgi:FkbM family methyltransferase